MAKTKQKKTNKHSKDVLIVILLAAAIVLGAYLIQYNFKKLPMSLARNSLLETNAKASQAFLCSNKVDLIFDQDGAIHKYNTQTKESKTIYQGRLETMAHGRSFRANSSCSQIAAIPERDLYKNTPEITIFDSSGKILKNIELSDQSKYITEINWLKDDINFSVVMAGKKDRSNHQFGIINSQTTDIIQSALITTDIGLGENTSLSPDGKRLAYQSEGQIFLANYENNKLSDARSVYNFRTDRGSYEAHLLGWVENGSAQQLYLVNQYMDPTGYDTNQKVVKIEIKTDGSSEVYEMEKTKYWNVRRREKNLAQVEFVPQQSINNKILVIRSAYTHIPLGDTLYKDSKYITDFLLLDLPSNFNKVQ